jgi:hypothetical protein
MEWLRAFSQTLFGPKEAEYLRGGEDDADANNAPILKYVYFNISKYGC